MSNRTTSIDERLYDYLCETTLRETEVMRRLRAETATMPHAGMQISPDQGQFMALLVEILGARQALEIGTFTGYSALCVAQALAPGGRLIACDVSGEFTRVARRYWAEAGMEERIELRLGPALETLAELRRAGRDGSFDFAFIDADKGNYLAYYEAVLELLRPGGVLAIDNTLWHGKIADPEVSDPDTEAIRAVNERAAGDPRVTMSLVTIGDGLLLARKR